MFFNDNTFFRDSFPKEEYKKTFNDSVKSIITEWDDDKKRTQ